ncbi:MAG: MFS transporter [Chloroflexi bacterium]|nr:MFS transporter [Chloroflexota bacterium]
MNIHPPSGMRAFIVFWIGQVISLMGSAMTWFAFTLWVWQKTGQASSLAIVSFLAFLPSILFMPIAGTFVDRWERKRTLVLSDMAGAIATFTVLILYTTDQLALWHIYLLSLLTGFFTAFQYPAYMSTITAILPKEDYSRAQGMVGLAQAAPSIFAPMLAAALLPAIGMTGIMTIDLFTFLAAFAALLWIKIPPRSDVEPAPTTQSGFTRDLSFGFRIIFANSRLRALTVLFIAANFFLAIGATLLSPTILSHTSNNERALAAVLTTGAIGGIVGGGLLSVWGGPKRRETGILLGGVGACLMGISLFGLARSVLVWSIAGFFFSFFEPFVEGGNAAIWQSTVDVNSQGRVFSARQLLTQIPYLIGVASSGWLAEFGIARLAGTQNGIHLSVTVLIAGILGTFIFLAGSFHPAIRHAE